MRAQKSANSLMDGGAYAPIVSRILKSGRWVSGDGEIYPWQFEMRKQEVVAIDFKATRTVIEGEPVSFLGYVHRVLATAWRPRQDNAIMTPPNNVTRTRGAWIVPQKNDGQF
jgi:hypothetical protein